MCVFVVCTQEMLIRAYIDLIDFTAVRRGPLVLFCLLLKDHAFFSSSNESSFVVAVIYSFATAN